MPDEDRRVLKPCPFCGGGGELGFDRDMEWSVCCADCVACSDFFPSKAGAIAAWNRRAADLLDRLEGDNTEVPVCEETSEVGSGAEWEWLDLSGADAQLLWGVTPGLKVPTSNAPPEYCPECVVRVYPRILGAEPIQRDDGSWWWRFEPGQSAEGCRDSGDRLEGERVAEGVLLEGNLRSYLGGALDRIHLVKPDAADWVPDPLHVVLYRLDTDQPADPPPQEET